MPNNMESTKHILCSS